MATFIQYLLNHPNNAIESLKKRTISSASEIKMKRKNRFMIETENNMNEVTAWLVRLVVKSF